MERIVSLNEDEIVLLREYLIEDIKAHKNTLAKTKNAMDVLELKNIILNCEKLFNKLR